MPPPEGATPKPQKLTEAQRSEVRREMTQYHLYSEVERICNMGIYGDMTPEEVEQYSSDNLLATAFDDGFRLFPKQCEALAAYEFAGGLLAPIGVGLGKTLLSLMIAAKAYYKGLEKIMLLVPSQVLGQLVDHDIQWARLKTPIPYPVNIIGGREAHVRLRIARSARKGLYILTHSLLSVRDTSELLATIRPELIIVDEAHALASASAARTMRIRGYMEEVRPEFAALSGTITAKTIRDYHHLAKWACREYNPLPNSTQLAQEWANVIDASAGCEEGPVSPGLAGPLMPLVRWAREHFPHERVDESITGFRKAFRLRLTSSPCVVSSGATDLPTSLFLVNRPVEDKETVAGWSTLESLMDQVSREWTTPNGDEIEHAIHVFKWLYELTSGFYNELTWPDPGAFARRRNLPEGVARDVLKRAISHHVLGQEYARTLRKWLETSSRPKLDTPMLVGHDMHINGAKNVGSELYQPWKAMRDADFDGRPDRDSRAVRVCPYKVMDMLAWAADLGKSKGGLIWCWHQEVALWAYETLQEAGYNALLCSAGESHNKEILDPANAKRWCVASIAAHSTGKNLQHFEHQYVMQWPRSPKTAEQLLGRTHRTGQKADELLVRTNATLEFDRLNFAACLNDSLYIHQTTGNRQKLIYAGYDPLPKIFPSAVLRERGMQNHMLSREQQRILDEKFGEIK